MTTTAAVQAGRTRLVQDCCLVGLEAARQAEVIRLGGTPSGAWPAGLPPGSPAKVSTEPRPAKSPSPAGWRPTTYRRCGRSPSWSKPSTPGVAPSHSGRSFRRTAPVSSPTWPTSSMRQHTLPVPTDIDLGHLDPFVRLAERIQEAGLDPEARAWLVNRLDLLRGAWVDLPAGMSDAVIHGDAWPGNVAVLDDGTALLLDFECTSVGPPEWEVTSTAVSRGTFGELAEADYRALCRAYGDADVQCWSRYPVLPDARELSLVCFALQSACQHPHAGQ